MKAKARNYKIEVRLGLAVIILILLILNFASHYTLYRTGHSLENRFKNSLYEAAIVAANYIYQDGVGSFSDSIRSVIAREYGLDAIEIIHFNYDRVLNIQKRIALDSTITAVDPGIGFEDLQPLLENRPVYRRRKSGESGLVLFPLSYEGSKYLVLVSGRDTFLGSVDNAGRTLVFFSILGLLVIAVVSRRFVNMIVAPFKRLKNKAEISGRLDADGSDEVSQVIGTYEKIIDDLQKNEKELIELNRLIIQKAENLEIYNNHILRSINTGLITIDKDGRISTINRAAMEILGLTEKDPTGCHYRDLFGPRTELDNLIGDFREDHSAIESRQVSLERPGLSKKNLSLSISQLCDCDGQTMGAVMILNDQTEFLKLRDELELKKRMALLGEMSGGLAHQLRNSLGAIVGFARLITKKAADREAAARNAAFLLNESREAEQLVSRFLDFARPLEMSPEKLDLSGLLRELCSQFGKKYPALKISFRPIRTACGSVTGDRLLLKQALGNIVDNACHAYGDEGGEVVIELDQIHESCRISIIDFAGGIPRKFREHVFTPFFSGSPGGTGLGLPLTRKIVAMHQGRTDFQTAAGIGTTFVVDLPIQAAPLPVSSTAEGIRS